MERVGMAILVLDDLSSLLSLLLSLLLLSAAYET